jgi:hypothetical protein
LAGYSLDGLICTHLEELIARVNHILFLLDELVDECAYMLLTITQALLEHSADPNALDDDGLAPVNLAVGNSEMVRLLAQHEADLRLGAKRKAYFI